MDDDVQAVVAEQVAYYRARARDYDHDIASRDKDWDQSIQELPISGDVLELACGTGRWTPLLAARARSVTAVDAAPEMLALARHRVGDLPVEFVEADVFADHQPGAAVLCSPAPLLEPAHDHDPAALGQRLAGVPGLVAPGDHGEERRPATHS